MNLIGRNFFHLCNQLVMHVTPSHVVWFLILANFPSVFSLVVHVILTLLNQRGESSCVVVCELAVHVSISLNLCILLVSPLRCSSLSYALTQFSIILITYLENFFLVDLPTLFYIYSILILHDYVRNDRNWTFVSDLVYLIFLLIIF